MKLKIDSKISRKLQGFESSSKLRFSSKEILLSALLHPSYEHENPSMKLKKFERLEFFGDAILNFIICEALYHKFTGAQEGVLSRMRSILVSRKLLHKIARRISLPRFILVGKSEKQHSAGLRIKLLADSLEAVIGALYMDSGFKKTKPFVLKLFSPYLDEDKLYRFDPNPKSTLQELSQKNFGCLPVYSIETVKKGFIASVRLARRVGKGRGMNKQEAEEAAAANLLSKLRIKKNHSRVSKRDSRRDMPV